jgi:hypothetical protein
MKPRNMLQIERAACAQYKHVADMVETARQAAWDRSGIGLQRGGGPSWHNGYKAGVEAMCRELRKERPRWTLKRRSGQ